MDVRPMRHGIGIAEAPGEALVERDVDHRFAGHAVHHEDVLYEHGFLLDELAYAKRVDRVPGIGRELDAGADLAELARLLEHEHAEVLACERERGGEPSNAAARDYDRNVIAGLQPGRLYGSPAKEAEVPYTQTCST